MKKFILGYKSQMTQIYRENGEIVPVTIIDCGNCIVAKYLNDKSGALEAVQLGLGVNKKPSRPLKGQYRNLEYVPKTIVEFALEDDVKPEKIGSMVKTSLFDEANKINISATSKGRGFAGVIKRHGFRRGPETHGSDHHRKPGSIGAMFPQRVLKGKKLPGHLGANKVTVKNSEIVMIDKTKNIIAVKGAVPGHKDSVVVIESA